MSGSRRVDTSDVKALRPDWLRDQKCGLVLKLLASAWSIWPHLTSLVTGVMAYLIITLL